MKKPTFSTFLKKNAEKFWRLKINAYLCSRFQGGPNEDI